MEHEQFDVDLEDAELLEEIELLSSLIIAATECDHRLATDDLDRILGVVPHRSDG